MEIPVYLRRIETAAAPQPPISNAYVQTGCEKFTESILQEAHRLTHGDRQADYGHPLDDYKRTAALVSALLAHKLKEPLTADEMALAMVCVKLSRQVHRPKRDNTVDGAGYFWVAQECRDEQERRKNSTTQETK